MTAFDGIRIIDFSEGIAGPMATMLLGDLGAEIIKVEPPGGDRMKDHPGYLCWNRNKRVVTLDLHSFAGLSAARSLLATADLAVFDWSPGELERSGLDPVTVRAANPALLHAWFPPYSPRGRWSQLPPDEGLLQAVTGVSWLQMSYQDQPTYLVTPQVSYGHAVLGAGVLASALYERERSGEGQSIVVSGLDALAAVEAGGTVRAAEMFRIGGRDSRGGVPNYRLYECSDGLWFFLGSLTPQFFLKALEATDMLHLMAWEGVDGEFANLLKPGINTKVIAALDERFKEKTRAEWLEILHDHDVPRGPVGVSEEWFRGETVSANDMRLEFEHERHGKVEIPGVPAKLSTTPGSVRALPTTAKLTDIPAHEPRITGAAGPGNGRGPLAGVRVLDLGAFIAGTFAPGIMSAWGADVIKVEPPEGDPFRTYGLGFIGYNLGKRGLALDLKKPEGRQAFLDLVRVSDVVLDNYRNGVRERLGIDYATLKEVNPRIISCSVTGYGPKGELSPDPGFDPLVQARSGLMNAQGGGEEPIFYQIPINDTGSAMVAAFGMVAALYARERTGEGQEVLTCLSNQSVLFQSGELSWYEGRPANPKGGIDCLGVAALNRFYQCADGGWVLVAATRPEHFPSLCVALGHPEWAGRLVAEKALLEPVSGALADQLATGFGAIPRDEAVDRLRTAGVPVAPALPVDALFQSPWLEENGYFQRFEHPLWGQMMAPLNLGHFSRTGGGYPRRSPLVGEHSTAILADCGFSADRIAGLIAAGVVTQA